MSRKREADADLERPAKRARAPATLEQLRTLPLPLLAELIMASYVVGVEEGDIIFSLAVHHSYLRCSACLLELQPRAHVRNAIQPKQADCGIRACRAPVTR